MYNLCPIKICKNVYTKFKKIDQNLSLINILSKLCNTCTVRTYLIFFTTT